MTQFSSLDAQLTQVVEHLQQELRSIRTGRANTELVANIIVEAYGSHTPLNQLASVTTTDATTLVIQPWDSSILKDVEKAIAASDTQLNPVNDGQLLRISLPALTEERRKELSKLVSQKGEEARIKVKQHREAVLKDLKNQEVSMDEIAKARDEMQKSIDRSHAEIERVVDAKTKEILSL